MRQVIFFVEDTPGGGFKAKAMGYPIEVEAGTAEELDVLIQGALREFLREDACHYLVRVVEEQKRDRLKRVNKTRKVKQDATTQSIAKRIES